MKGGFVIDAGVLRPERPPVLLLGGLDLLRPLGAAGIPAIVATPDALDPALDSRYCRGRLRLPPLHRREAAIGTLLGAGLRLRSALGCRVPLYYGTDDHLSLISDARETLEQFFLFLVNPPEVSRALLSKERFAALAREHRLPVPRTLQWEELGSVRGPVLVKPRHKAGWEDSAIRLRLFDGAGKARVFPSSRAVLAHPLAMRLREQLSFQEYVAGDDRHLYSYHGFGSEDGAPLAWFVGRKLRTFPALTGMSSYLELAHDGEVAALGREVAARLALRGERPAPPPRGERALQPLASPRGGERRQPAAHRLRLPGARHAPGARARLCAPTSRACACASTATCTRRRCSRSTAARRASYQPRVKCACAPTGSTTSIPVRWTARASAARASPSARCSTTRR